MAIKKIFTSQSFTENKVVKAGQKVGIFMVFHTLVEI